MTTVTQLQPKINAKERKRTNSNKANAKVIHFEPKEINMMPGEWQEPGSPTPYELRVTIHTCKRLWKLNKEALKHPECDVHATQENIKLLEHLYVHLMSYLEE
jgi:hypothetical protein